MGQNIDVPKEPSIGLEQLPNELLVYIFSFLPTSSDIVRLRYVSRKMKSISEIPSLWNNLLWPWYDQREERSLNGALEVCGTHINRIVLPDFVSCVRSCLRFREWGPEWDHLGVEHNIWINRRNMKDFRRMCFSIPPSTAMKMLRHCCNVTEVTLGICLNGDEVKEIVEEMKYLTRLEICSSISIPSKPIIAAAGCANLEELVLRYAFVDHDMQRGVLAEWVNMRFQPPNLSIVLFDYYWLQFASLEMLKQWPQWNSEIPAGHTASFKQYITECNLWDASSAVPVFQLDFGQTATYPFVKASNLGLLGFGEDRLLLTNSTSNGKVVHKASVIESNSFYTTNLRYNVSNLSFVTDFTAIKCGLLSGHLEQLSIACCNLERLNLTCNIRCLESLQGLKNIVDRCHNLQGINLENVHVAEVENCMELWEVLSEIKMLNLLRIELCIMKPFIEADVCSQYSFLQLALKFVHLEQLELMDNDNREAPCLHFSDKSNPGYTVFLSYLPSLVACYLENPRTVTPAIVDIITKCKYLKYFKYFQWEQNFSSQSLSTAPNKYLQYLDIDAWERTVSESFMSSVSAHGKLEFVLLRVRSVMTDGITVLIENSPKLCLFIVLCYSKLSRFEHIRLINFKEMLKKKFLHRKLFSLDGFIMMGRPKRSHEAIII